MDWRAFFAEYRWRIIGVLCGVALTVLIFTLGFWRTLLLLAVVGLCYLLGSQLDRGGVEGLAKAIAALFTKK